MILWVFDINKDFSLSWNWFGGHGGSIIVESSPNYRSDQISFSDWRN